MIIGRFEIQCRPEHTEEMAKIIAPLKHLAGDFLASSTSTSHAVSRTRTPSSRPRCSRAAKPWSVRTPNARSRRCLTSSTPEPLPQSTSGPSGRPPSRALSGSEARASEVPSQRWPRRLRLNAQAGGGGGEYRTAPPRRASAPPSSAPVPRWRATGLPVTTFRAPNLFFGGCQAVARHRGTGALLGGADARRGGAVRYSPPPPPPPPS